jgi:hypothetical protein
MKSEAQQSREADLYLARQFGQAFVREPNSQQVRADFDRIFKGDSEAQEQFEFGIVEEDQKRLTLGLSRVEFHAYHATKQGRHVAKRRPNGRI